MSYEIIEVDYSNSTEMLIPALNAVVRAMDKESYKYVVDRETIRAKFRTRRSSIDLVICSTKKALLGSIGFNVFIQEEQRREVLLFINEVNWSLSASNLEMDPRDGEMRCRLTIPTDLGRCTEVQAAKMLQTLSGTAGRYADCILQLAFENARSTTVLEALRAENE